MVSHPSPSIRDKDLRSCYFLLIVFSFIAERRCDLVMRRGKCYEFDKLLRTIMKSDLTVLKTLTKSNASLTTHE